MSETVPERSAPSSGGGVKGTFTNKIGPLPMWAWVAIIAAVIVAWRWYASKQAASSSTSSTASDSTSANDVPQFVNQTYVQSTAPVQGPAGAPGPQGPPGTPAPAPKPQQLTRTWTSLGGSTYAEVAQRLLGNTDVSNLHPANKAAQNWVDGPYKKNHNAKMPKGLEFTYTEGTVTSKTGGPIPVDKGHL